MIDSPIVRFLVQDGRDGAGRTFAQVLAFGDAELERRHDFVQWLFPLGEPSAAGRKNQSALVAPGPF